MWLFRRKNSEPDIDAFFESVVAAQVGKYSRTDQYNDFRAVFGSPRGRRVLWKIFEWCRMAAPVSVKGDPYETYRRDGERNIGLRIMATMNAEPFDEPETVEEKGDARHGRS